MSGPELRIGDDDREAAVTALGEHYAAGRLTKDEYDERSARAWEARTMSALTPLFADLPRAQAAPRASGQTPSARPALAPGRGRPGWLLPVLVVIGVLVVLTHLPLVLLLILGWIFLARSGRHWGRHHQHGHQPGHQPGRGGQGGWVR